jgi:F-type H+-transporting ATPase subunit epsilon
VPLEVHIVTPEREVWTGTAEMLIARGVDGEVGILAGHAPLLVQLAIGPLRILHEGAEDVTAVVDGGFLHVGTHDGVTRADVLATHAELATEIDQDAARQAIAELEGKIPDLTDEEIESAKAELQKALVRIKLVG